MSSDPARGMGKSRVTEAFRGPWLGEYKQPRVQIWFPKKVPRPQVVSKINRRFSRDLLAAHIMDSVLYFICGQILIEVNWRLSGVSDFMTETLSSFFSLATTIIDFPV